MATSLARGASGRGSGKVHDIGSSSTVIEISSFPTDLRTLTNQYKACRKLIIHNVGAASKVLGYTCADGVARTLDATNLQGVAMEIEAISLDNSSTVAKVLVFF